MAEVYQIYELTADSYGFVIKLHKGTAATIEKAKARIAERMEEMKHAEFYTRTNLLYRGMTETNPIVMLERFEKEERITEPYSFGGFVIMRDRLIS